MRKGILLLAVLFISTTVALYGKKIRYQMYEKPATKTVEFSVYAEKGYSSSLYKNSRASVTLTIYKYAADGRQIVWKGTIDEGKIKNYPTAETPLIRRVGIFDVYESHETLVAAYEVNYTSKGSTITYEDGVILAKGSTQDTLAVKI